MVVLPDWYRGKAHGPDDGMDKLVEFLKAETKSDDRIVSGSERECHSDFFDRWDAIKSDWETKVKPYCEERGAKVFGAVGGTRFGAFFFFFKKDVPR